MANLYKIERMDNTWDYDVYDSAIVVAESEDEATFIHPGTTDELTYYWSGLDRMWFMYTDDTNSYAITSWLTPSKVSATLIGTAAPHFQPGTVVCASFNAG